MFRIRNIGFITLVIAVLFIGAIVVRAEKASIPKDPDKIALGENEVKQLLLLMDTDKNGKISRQEYMRFMAAEFDRLDKDKSGELDTKELSKSQLRSSRVFASVGK